MNPIQSFRSASRCKKFGKIVEAPLESLGLDQVELCPYSNLALVEGKVKWEKAYL